MEFEARIKELFDKGFKLEVIYEMIKSEMAKQAWDSINSFIEKETINSLEKIIINNQIDIELGLTNETVKNVAETIANNFEDIVKATIGNQKITEEIFPVKGITISPVYEISPDTIVNFATKKDNSLETLCNNFVNKKS